MANVTKTEAVVEVVRPAGINLEISLEEAEMLAAILGRFETGGPTSDMWGALMNADVSYHKHKVALKNKENDEFPLTLVLNRK